MKRARREHANTRRRPAMMAAMAVLVSIALEPLAGAHARAAEVLTFTVPGGIGALEYATGIGGGIATGKEKGGIALTLGDGSRFMLTTRGGVLSLTRLDAKPGAVGKARPPDILPDGAVTEGKGGIARAWLAAPTRRYDHGVLGDAVEASRVMVENDAGQVFGFVLGPESVFEDLRARIVDLDGDRKPEVVVVRSFLQGGAALSVLTLTEAGLAIVAETPPIGRPFRWLNPAAAADLDGDGRIEIAYVETPHIGGILRLFELRDGQLVPEIAGDGFSNHAIGSRVLDMAAVVDWNRDGVVDLALPDSSRLGLRIISFAGDNPVEIDRATHDSDIVTAVLAANIDADARKEIVYGLADGTLIVLDP